VAAFVGVENLAFEVLPVDPGKPEDVKAAGRVDYLVNHQFFTGVFAGDIDLDLDGKATPSKNPLEVHDAELERTFDFIGLNYYGRLRADPGMLASLAPLYGTPHFDVRDYDPTLPHSDAWLEISASGLRSTIEAYSRYGVPMIITENGDPDADDDQRPMFLLEHFYEAARAAKDGFDVRGYYYWTISDNFEWSDGTSSKEGLFQVDFTSPALTRTRTRSADLFLEVAREGVIDEARWKAWSLPQYPVGVP
jgi:beta-glucosidase/6-phospho-beta-glucosidase/beta-galactosidase